MKKQNIKHTLMATAITSLLAISQGVMAQTNTTIHFQTLVTKTSCNVSAVNAGNLTTVNGQLIMPFGSFLKKDIGMNTTGAQQETIGDSKYTIIQSQATPITLTFSGCDGDSIEAPVDAVTTDPKSDAVPAGILQLKALGSAALGGKDVYGDSVNNRGFGYAMKYAVSGGSTNNTHQNDTGYLSPTKGSIDILEVSKGDDDITANGVDDLDLTVTLTPQLAAWAASSAEVMDGTLDTGITFSVLQN